MPHKIVSQKKDHQNLDQFGRLELKSADLKPALRPLALLSCHNDKPQKTDGAQIDQPGKTQYKIIINIGYQKHNDDPGYHTDDLLFLVARACTSHQRHTDGI